MKISMYELLGLVKDGKAPNKIKYQNYIYEYQHRRDTENAFNYMCNENGEYLSRRYFIDNILNDGVEILEEEKKIPEKLEYWQGLDKVRNDCELDDLEYAIKYGNYNFEMFFNKINQIIDYLKSKGE